MDRISDSFVACKGISHELVGSAWGTFNKK